MTGPLDPRTRAALDALDERLVAEQINLRLYVSSGIVGAYVFDPAEDPADFAAAADRGDEVLATIGADIAQQHGLPPDRPRRCRVAVRQDASERCLAVCAARR